MRVKEPQYATELSHSLITRNQAHRLLLQSVQLQSLVECKRDLTTCVWNGRSTRSIEESWPRENDIKKKPGSSVSRLIADASNFTCQSHVLRQRRNGVEKWKKFLHLKLIMNNIRIRNKSKAGWICQTLQLDCAGAGVNSSRAKGKRSRKASRLLLGGRQRKRKKAKR